jgi:hypothetical protein
VDEPHGPAARGEDEQNTFYSHHQQYMSSVAYWGPTLLENKRSQLATIVNA